MKRVVILALRDKEGRVYACPSASGKSQLPEQTLSEVRMGECSVASVVELFPFSTFTSLSDFDRDKFERIFMEADLEISEKEWGEAFSGSLRSYQFHNRQMVPIKELRRPFAYAKSEFIRRREGARNTYGSGISYEMLVWQHLMGFNSDEEFEDYLYFRNGALKSRDYPFCITGENLAYFNRMLEESNAPIQIHRSHLPGNVKVEDAVVREKVDGLSEKHLVRLLLEWGFAWKVISPHRFTRTLCDELFRRESEASLLLHMLPNEALSLYTGDELLSLLEPELFYLKKEMNYEPEVSYEDEYSGCQADYWEESVYDARDDEVEKLERVLPRVTIESLPILKTLVAEFILPLLPPEVSEVLLLEEE